MTAKQWKIARDKTRAESYDLVKSGNSRHLRFTTLGDSRSLVDYRRRLFAIKILDWLSRIDSYFRQIAYSNTYGSDKEWFEKP